MFTLILGKWCQKQSDFFENYLTRIVICCSFVEKIMKTITLENGTKVQISDESYENLQKAAQEEDVLMHREGEVIFFPDMSGKKFSTGVGKSHGTKLSPFECLTEDIYDKAEAFIKLRNYMERVNGEFENTYYYVVTTRLEIDYWSPSYSKQLMIYFSSEELAERALKEHRELFEILYK